MGRHIRAIQIGVGITAIALGFGSGAAQADSSTDTTIPAETTETTDTTVPTDTLLPADVSEPVIVVEPVECELLTADVTRETVTFTVGPDECVGEVGPISFSAFFLPGGMREPYEDQVLIAHHDSNGSSYGAGSYELTIAMGTPCNWQTDLYYGVNLMPKFRGLIAYDYDEREVCVEETTTTTSTTTTTTTTIAPEAETTTTSTTSTTSTSTTSTSTPRQAAVTTTTALAAGGGNATTTSVASAGPIPTPVVGSQTLPATGSAQASVLLLLAGLLVAAGLFARRMAR